MQIGSERLLKRQGTEGLAARAVLVAHRPHNLACHYKGRHCPREPTGRGPQSTCNSSGTEVDWRAGSAHKSFPPLPKEGPHKGFWSREPRWEPQPLGLL